LKNGVQLPIGIDFGQELEVLRVHRYARGADEGDPSPKRVVMMSHFGLAMSKAAAPSCLFQPLDVRNFPSLSQLAVLLCG
jgi:hypothetical protein